MKFDKKLLIVLGILVLLSITYFVLIYLPKPELTKEENVTKVKEVKLTEVNEIYDYVLNCTRNYYNNSSLFVSCLYSGKVDPSILCYNKPKRIRNPVLLKFYITQKIYCRNFDIAYICDIYKKNLAGNYSFPLTGRELYSRYLLNKICNTSYEIPLEKYVWFDDKDLELVYYLAMETGNRELAYRIYMNHKNDTCIGNITLEILQNCYPEVLLI